MKWILLIILGLHLSVRVQMVVCFSKIHGNSLLSTGSTCQLISIGFHGYTNKKHMISTGLLFLTFLSNISHTHSTEVLSESIWRPCRKANRHLHIRTCSHTVSFPPSLLPPSHPSIHPSLPPFLFLPVLGIEPRTLCAHQTNALLPSSPLNYLSSLFDLPLSHASRGQKMETGTVNGWNRELNLSH